VSFFSQLANMPPYAEEWYRWSFIFEERVKEPSGSGPADQFDLNGHRINELEKRVYQLEFKELSQRTTESELRQGLTRAEERTREAIERSREAAESKNASQTLREAQIRTEEKLEATVKYGTIFVAALFAMVPVVFTLLLKQGEAITRLTDAMKLIQTTETKKTLEAAAQLKLPAELATRAADISSTLQAAQALNIPADPTLAQKARDNMERLSSGSPAESAAVHAASAYTQFAVAQAQKEVELQHRTQPSWMILSMIAGGILGIGLLWLFHTWKSRSHRILNVPHGVFAGQIAVDPKSVASNEYVIARRAMRGRFPGRRMWVYDLLIPGVRVVFTDEIVRRSGVEYVIVTFNKERYKVLTTDVDKVKRVVSEHSIEAGRRERD
jgi:hypothetical protein